MNEGINVLSLFDGMSCGQIALDKLGINVKNYFASEIKPYAIATTMMNYPNTIQIGDVTKVTSESLPNIDLMIGGSPCFIAGTKVITNKGYKNIEDIVNGDLVCTHLNRFRKVLKTGNTIKDTIILKIIGLEDTETTNEHPYYIRTLVFGELSPPEWIEAKDISINDYVGIPIIDISLDDKDKESNIYSNIFIEDLINNKGGIKDNGIVWIPYHDTVVGNKSQVVYNIEVEDDNSYTANNAIVHNCQDFSMANKTITGLDGEKSKLFMEYLRILKEVKPKYFLLENVKMKKEHEDIITNFLGVSPIAIDSKVLCGAFRKRLYWTNIPGITQPVDKGVLLQDVLEYGYTNREKAMCLLESDSRPSSTPVKMFHRYYMKSFTTLIFKDEQHFKDCKAHYDENFKGLPAKDIHCDSDVYNGVRYLTKTERERLQTVPSGYCENLSNNEAACLLGDGWTVDVISHIFSFMENN